MPKFKVVWADSFEDERLVVECVVTILPNALEVHEIPPYSEIYGMHPREFVFGKNSEVLPARFIMMPFWGTYFHLVSWVFVFLSTHSDPGDTTNRVRRTQRPKESSPVTPETPKVESGDPGDLKNRVWRPAMLLSHRQQRCCLRDSNVAVSETATLLSLRQQR